MLSAQGLIRGLVARYVGNVPRNPDSQNNDVAIRLGAFGEHWSLPLFNGLQGLAEEGSYYIAASPTPGTGIVSSSTTGTTQSDTTGMLAIYNTDQAKHIYLDFIAMLITTAPTSATAQHVAHAIDNINRNPSKGGTLLQGTNQATDASPAVDGVAQIYVNPTLVVANNRRWFGRQVVRTVIPVVNDLWVWKFGNQEAALPLGFGPSVATAQQQQFQVAPVIIGPGSSYVMNDWAPGRAAATSAEWVIGYAVR